MVIALIPMFVLKFWNITQFPFGGTSILITVGVMLETMKQLDSQLMMRNYEGFLELSARRALPRLVLLGKQGAGKGTQAARLARPLRRRAPVDGRDLPRPGGAGHRVRPRGQALHGRRRARPRRDRRRSDRGVPRARRSARRRLRARRFPPHAAPGQGARPRARRPPAQPRDQPRRAPRDRARPAWPAGACARTASACTT